MTKSSFPPSFKTQAMTHPVLRLICITETQNAQLTKPCGALNVAAIKGYVSLNITTSYSCDEALYGAHFDAIILQKNETGTLLVRHLHNSYPRLPIFVIIDNALPAGIADLLDAGADDCQPSNIKSVELMARLRAIIRRTLGDTSQQIKLGRLTVNDDEKRVTLDDEDMHFTPKEFALVSFLVRRKQQLTNKEHLIHHLYRNEEIPEGKAIDVLLHRVRRKFIKHHIKEPFVTQWGAGWKINNAAFKTQKMRHNRDVLPSHSTETSIPITGKINMLPTHDSH